MARHKVLPAYPADTTRLRSFLHFLDGILAKSWLFEGEDSNLKEETWTSPHVAAFWKAVERDADHLEANEDDSEKITASMKNLSISPL